MKHVLHHLRNVVNVENFKSQAPPPVTEFLKEIQDSSKSLNQQTLEALIENQTGLFKHDLLTAHDMLNVIKTESAFDVNHIYCDGKKMTPNSIYQSILKIPGVYRMRGRKDNGASMRIYAIRNGHKYMNLGPTDAYNQYISQMEPSKVIRLFNKETA